RPVRVTYNPATTEVSSIVPIIGTIKRPATVALTPAAICKYVGMYPRTPNIDTPTSKPAVVVNTKLRSRNSAGGMMGSAAPVSTQANSTAATTPATINPIIWTEPQSYSDPPQVAANTKELVAIAISAMPA